MSILGLGQELEPSYVRESRSFGRNIDLAVWENSGYLLVVQVSAAARQEDVIDVGRVSDRANQFSQIFSCGSDQNASILSDFNIGAIDHDGRLVLKKRAIQTVQNIDAGSGRLCRWRGSLSAR